ncbi:MAG TPA: hypothetical protein VGF48_21365 [Thermoanaerobaculia bacterium]|jgi:hypothetical protein
MNRPLANRHPLDGLYAGRPIFVLSTGTSLRGFDFSRLNGRITIGINRIIEHYRPSILHFVDVTAHKTHARALRDYNGMIISGHDAAPAGTHDNSFEIHHNEDTFELHGGMTSLNPYVGRSFSEGLFGGGGGCTALHIAILLGADPIYLLGYDYYEENGRHFDAFDPACNARDLYDVSLQSVEHIARQDWLPRIYNCNPRSRLRAFPFVDIEMVLSNGIHFPEDRPVHLLRSAAGPA